MPVSRGEPVQFAGVDPRTGKQLPGDYHLTSAVDLESILVDAVDAQATWAESDSEARRAFCRKAAAGLDTHRGRLARLIVAEVGKPHREALAEVDKCIALSKYCAEHLGAALRPVSLPGATEHVSVYYRPLGITLGIMPWNFPLWQVARFAVPAIAAGNAALLKHAPNVPACAQAFTEIMQAACPGGLFASLRLDVAATEALVADNRIAGVSLPGSVAAGRAIGAAAGKSLTPSVLELGGSDAYLVLHDADVDLAARRLVDGRMVNAGQSCIGPKRLIVVDAVRERFLDALLAYAKTWQTLSKATDESPERFIGPLARADLKATLHQQVMDTVSAGADCLLGGELPGGPGFFYPPTVLDRVPAGSPAYEQELFGPVLSIIHVGDEEAAIQVANDSAFGLGGGVFSRDLARAERIAAHRLRAGAVVVNDFVRSDPRVPFGGVRDSGFGRELSIWGLRAFCNVKSVAVAPPGT